MLERSLEPLPGHLRGDEPDARVDDGDEEEEGRDEEEVRNEKPASDAPEEAAHQVPEGADEEDGKGEAEDEAPDRRQRPTGEETPDGGEEHARERREAAPAERLGERHGAFTRF